MMFHPASFRIVLLMALLAGASVASSTGGAMVDVDAAAEAAYERAGLTGLAVVVMRGSDLVLAQGYGHADVASGRPATPETPFEIGSITKQFTAAAIMRLVEEGLLGLDDPITDHLPDYPTQGRTVHVRQLLRHTSGIQEFIMLPDFWERSGDLDRPRAELVDMFAVEPFVFEPGARWAYSNSNYTLLALIIEAVSGQSYAAYLEAAFFEPLGLDSTRVCDTLPGVGRAQGYYLDDGVAHPAPAENMAWALGDGAICSSALDLAKWQRALVTGGVVHPSSYEQMIATEPLADGTTPPYGFALSLVELDGRSKVAHSGRMGGFSGALAYYPDHDLTVAILTNLAGIEPETVERSVARAALGLPAPAMHDVALPDEERHRYLGEFDTGVFPIVVVEEDGRLYAEAAGWWPLLYLGDGVFVVEGEPDVIRLSFDADAQSVLLEFAGMHWYGRRVP
jgi:D-alanyl-D-alanine carboxypeptidase